MTLIKEIFETEKKADDILKNAAAKKDDKINAARQKTISELAEGKKKVEAAVDKTVKAAMKKLEQRKEKIISTHQKQADEIDESSDRKKAVQFLVDKVMDGKYEFA